EAVVDRGRVSFHFPDGFLCPRCRAARRNRPTIREQGRSHAGFTISIAESTFQLMRKLMDDRVRPEDFFSSNENATIPTELRIVLNQWIAEQLGRIPRTAEFLPRVVGPLRRIRRFTQVT
ncbi:MAG: hypothetical protein Q4C47_07500, partial [Planctomycetia bacterium]|nr:hypothetical protein [Planctomycetia bacterium]